MTGIPQSLIPGDRPKMYRRAASTIVMWTDRTGTRTHQLVPTLEGEPVLLPPLLSHHLHSLRLLLRRSLPRMLRDARFTPSEMLCSLKEYVLGIANVLLGSRWVELA